MRFIHTRIVAFIAITFVLAACDSAGGLGFNNLSNPQNTNTGGTSSGSSGTTSAGSSGSSDTSGSTTGSSAGTSSGGSATSGSNSSGSTDNGTGSDSTAGSDTSGTSGSTGGSTGGDTSGTSGSTGGSTGGDPTPPTAAAPKSRYDLALGERCFALQATDTQKHAVRASGSYATTATNASDAHGFYAQPSALGKYLFLGNDDNLLASSGNALQGFSLTTTATPAEAADWTVYADQAQTYFVLVNAAADNQALTSNAAGALSFTAFAATVDANGELIDESVVPAGQRFQFIPTSGCSIFPELTNDVAGDTFTGTRTDGTVAGFADVHVHWSATDFLGGAEHGWPFHRFGVNHALNNCDATHGPEGREDLVIAALAEDFDGHDVSGYPDFIEWPAPGMLTHEGMYYKWVERAWKAGLRIMVNDLVENRVLCELVTGTDPGIINPVCNEMASVHKQIDFMNEMQDYIDAQYGGPGKGWMRLVSTPQEARQVIADGKLAVVQGVEISHIFNCQVNYATATFPEDATSGNPGEPETETSESFHAYGQDPVDDRIEENGSPDPSKLCTETGIQTQLDDLWNKGVRQLFPIHEFDNAFGGNGIFTGLVLNMGNRRDTGRFWQTYECPDNGTGNSYFYNAGAVLETSTASLCNNAGEQQAECQAFAAALQVGLLTDSAGNIANFPAYPATRQCNARWMTPLGDFMFNTLMKKGIIIEIDHLELEMKSQIIAKADAAPLDYPLVSTHGGHGGITKQQATNMLKLGGMIYPYKPNGSGYISRVNDIAAVTPDDYPYPFAVGFGADTNGLGSQAKPQSEAINYPFTLFQGTDWDNVLGDGINVSPLTFNMSQVAESGRKFNINTEGQSHYGLVADFVEQVRVAGGNDANSALKALYNSAETYLQMWERTLAASAAINAQ